MEKKFPKIAYLSNIPGPYRERMHELIADRNPPYSVIYCAKIEPDRIWTIEHGDYDQHFLADKSKNFSYNQPQVWKLLNKLNPDVLIITQFKPTMMYGVLWCIMKGKKLIVYSDGTYISERNFSFGQKLARRFAFRNTKAFVTPAKGGLDLYRSYGIPDYKMFISCLCIDNSKFTQPPIKDREFHLMFSGQIVERKMPMFFVEVAKKLKTHIPDLKVLVVGEGNLRKRMLDELEKNNIRYYYPGYLDQKLLPSFYSKAKIFLFPSLNDPWGVVGNEACAAGTPVITCDNAGVANDLIVNGENGYVLPLDADVWTEHALKLLTDTELLCRFSANAVRMVQPYNHDQAADGILKSVAFALS